MRAAEWKGPERAAPPAPPARQAFFSASRISVSRSTSLGPADVAGASGFAGIIRNELALYGGVVKTAGIKGN